MVSGKVLWIAWEKDASIRSKVLAKELNAKFYTFTLFEGINWLSILRYPIAKIQTFFTLIKETPKILVVQNPSIVLSFFAAFIRPLFRYKLIIDLHTQYLHPKWIKGVIMNKLNKYSLNNCSLIIVTNESYKNKIKNQTNKKIFVLPDKIPEFESKFKRLKLKGKQNILNICTFSEDEPWKQVIQAAKLLDKDTYIYITGNYKNKLNKKHIPSNVILTGFVQTKLYQNLLRSSDAILVLTNEEDCMVCGGYEAVAAEKALILSNKMELKRYFNKGTVFTNNTNQSIKDAINKALKNKTRLSSQIKKLKITRNKEWQIKWKNLLNFIFS